jgi:hypothetical protein
MSRSQNFRFAWILTIILCAWGGHPATAQADSEILPGTYRCSAYNVSGGGGSCRNMQPLLLKEDGSYQYSSTRGRWITYGGKLLLSGSQLWGEGEILGRDTVRFEYDYRDWRHTVTWICQECAAEVSGTAMPSSSAYVGVSLTLEFAEPIGGVSGFVIVPSKYAPRYTHNAPLPEGAVQGSAWETGSTAVALATNRNNGLTSGRRYVVFLAWPRETLPVAILDLPPLDRDYAATLPATLDGAAVLRRIGVSTGGSADAYPPPFSVPSEGPPAYPASDGGMPAGMPAPASPGGPSPGQQSDSGGNSGLRDFVNTVNELGRAFDGLRQLGKKGRQPEGTDAPPPSPPPSHPPASPYPSPDPSTTYPPPPATYPDTISSSSGGSSAYPSDYPAYPPAPTEAPGPPPGYGTPTAWPAAEPPPAPPRCNPQVPKYTQPGCVE